MARKSNFSESEIINALHEIESGISQTDTARKMGVSTQTVLRWRASTAA